MTFSFFDVLERITPLHPRLSAGGLEISDFALRFVRWEKGTWGLYSEKLIPGVVQNGEIKENAAFVDSLRKLHAQIMKQESRKKIGVVVSLNTPSIYSQVFSLPIVSGENLERAIELNLQMVSPDDLAREYAGWEILDRDMSNQSYSVFTAFAERTITDAFERALAEGGFAVVVFEFRALAFARMIREQAANFNPAKPYLVLALSNDGLDSLVLRKGKLYFEYFNFWRDMFQSEERAVPLSVFETAVLRNLNQVTNFYIQHWPNDKIAGVLVAAGDLSGEARKIIEENFSLPVIELTPKDQAVSSEWFVALGSGIRSLVPRRKDREINFLGMEAREELRREHLIRFFDFWRVAIPVTLAVIAALFVASDVLLARTRTSLEANPPITLEHVDLKELETLQEKVATFNDSVSFILTVRKHITLKSPLFEKINAKAAASGVRIDTITFPNLDAPVRIAGEGQTTEKIVAFKSAMEADPQFAAVTLPITEIKPSLHGQAFVMTFFINSSIAP